MRQGFLGGTRTREGVEFGVGFAGAGRAAGAVDFGRVTTGIVRLVIFLFFAPDAITSNSPPRSGRGAMRESTTMTGRGRDRRPFIDSARVPPAPATVWSEQFVPKVLKALARIPFSVPNPETVVPTVNPA